MTVIPLYIYETYQATALAQVVFLGLECNGVQY